ncbi:antifungal protein ginkbilobin-2-like [Panicum miliaceum]|uniref:Antifungal protein ginkbilobin-2-like n=1 Tax=Panicum miliaceum TaxID=4540 RepID=A0A3L6QV69_PANMI|nr:antifungal protein ginkbilobin-2-like [Panicum miliaceum]
MASSTQPPPLLLPAISLLSLLLALASPRGAAAAPNTAALSVLCNGASYGAGDPFAAGLAYVLAELVSATPARPGRDFYDISPYPAAFAYGHAACRPAAALPSADDCAACLRSAVSQMEASCGRSVGARAVLVDCSVRYEQYAFVD